MLYAYTVENISAKYKKKMYAHFFAETILWGVKVYDAHLKDCKPSLVNYFQDYNQAFT